MGVFPSDLFLFRLASSYRGAEGLYRIGITEDTVSVLAWESSGRH